MSKFTRTSTFSLTATNLAYCIADRMSLAALPNLYLGSQPKKFGIAMVERTAMIPITVINSNNVNPDFLRIVKTNFNYKYRVCHFLVQCRLSY